MEPQDIAHRLKNDVCMTSPLDWQEHVALAREAADEITRLRALVEELKADRIRINDEAEAEIKRLREALEPFAALFEARRDAYSKRYKDHALGYANFDKMPDHWNMDACIFDMGDFRRARKALEGGE